MLANLSEDIASSCPRSFNLMLIVSLFRPYTFSIALFCSEGTNAAEQKSDISYHLSAI